MLKKLLSTVVLSLFLLTTAPTLSDAGHVRSYTKKDGTHVSGYHRSSNKRHKLSASQKKQPKKHRIARDSRGRIKRSSAAKHEFMKASGHPHGWEGHEVDHKIPLHKGGPDTPESMQWLTIEQHKKKTAAEAAQ